MSNGEGRSTEGFGIDRDASVNLIVKTAVQNGVENPKQVAYMLATAQHETRNFNAPEEDFGRSQARKLGYQGGEDFYGRGYVHLTHDYNYKQFDALLGMNGKLVKNPDLAKDPETAAKILVIGMRDGLFTGKRLDRYIDEDKQDFYNARRTVNGITKADWTVKAAADCERYARQWEQLTPSLIESAKQQIAQDAYNPVRDMRHGIESIMNGTARFGPAMTDGGMPEYLLSAPARAKLPLADGVLREGEQGTAVGQLQTALNARDVMEGRTPSLVVDNEFGPATRRAVESFQIWNGLDATGIADRQTLSALRHPKPPSNDMSDAADLRDRNQGYAPPSQTAPAGPRMPAKPTQQEMNDAAEVFLGYKSPTSSAPVTDPGKPMMPGPVQTKGPRDNRGPNDPAHSDHADYMKIREAVLKDGRWTGEQIDNISAAAFKEYKADPMLKRLDSVQIGSTLPNGDVNIFAAYQPWGLGKESFHSHVSAQQAANKPAEQSFEQAQQITRQQALAQQQEMARSPNDPSQGGQKMTM